MNRLIVPNGGMPFTGDDLVFLQDAMKDAFSGFIKSIIPDSNAILSGLEFTGIYSPLGNTYELSEGYVLIDNEVCYFPTSNVPASGVLVLELDISYDPNGLEIHADQVAKDTYEIRQAKIVASTDQPDEIVFTELNRLKKYIGGTTTTVLPVNDPFAGTIRAYKTNEMVLLEGNLIAGITQISDIILTLPLNLRPSIDLVFVVKMIDNPHIANLHVYANGEVKIDSYPVNTLNVIAPAYLNGITWHVTG